MSKVNYLILFPIILCQFACKTTPLTNLVERLGPFESHLNVQYAKDDSLEQAMDVYLPNHRDAVNTPIVLFLHGGAWVVGDKNEYLHDGIDTFFTSQGIAFINMNYRLDYKYLYPSALTDIEAALAFIKANATKWNINANKICMFGNSSGAHLALLYAYARNTEGRIKTVIDCMGPSNLTDTSIVEHLLGQNVIFMLGLYQNNPQLWWDASPASHMAAALPTVIMQGAADTLVRQAQATGLYDSLLNRGIPCMYIAMEGNRHGWPQSRWQEWKQPIVDWIKKFL